MRRYESSVYIFDRLSNSWLGKYKQITLLVSLIFIFSIGTARSYVNDSDRFIITDRTTSVSHETLVVSSGKALLPAADSICSSLLSTQQHDYPSKHPAVRTQRSVGKAAVLGLLVGVRFALEPKQQYSTNAKYRGDRLNHPALNSATDIVAYRNCLKNEILTKIALSQ